MPETKRKLVKKREDTHAVTIKLELGDTFEVGSSKDKDFDLDMDAGTYQGKKGQAGTRTKSGGDGPAGTFAGLAQVTRER